MDEFVVSLENNDEVDIFFQYKTIYRKNELPIFTEAIIMIEFASELERSARKHSFIQTKYDYDQ